MAIQPILYILSVVCLLIAAFTSFGRVNIGWLGMALFVLASIVR